MPKVPPFLTELARDPRPSMLVLIVSAALFVVMSYGYLLWVDESARGYLGHWAVFGIMVVPYVVCAAIWFRPHRHPQVASLAAVTTAGILFLFAAASSLWRVSLGARWNGDMQAVFVIFEAGVVTIGVIVVSVLAYAVYRLAHDG